MKRSVSVLVWARAESVWARAVSVSLTRPVQVSATVWAPVSGYRSESVRATVLAWESVSVWVSQWVWV
jgi:hypothetical protein